MGVNVTVDGTSYTVPETGERDWGQNTTDLLVALANVSLLIKGGSIPLTSEADFGATAGLKAVWFSSRTANSADAGVIRLANLDAVNWRNAANSANLTLTVNGSDQLTFDGNQILDTAYISGTLAGAGLVENAGALDVNVDDASIEIATDVVQVKDLGITTAKINALAVTTAKINALAVTTAELGALSVTDAKVNDVAAGKITGQIITSQITDDAVDKDKIAADVAGVGLGQNVDGSLEVNVDDSTVEVSTDTLQVKALGIDTAQLAADSVDKDKIAADVAGIGLGQNVDGSLEVNVDDSTIEVATDTLQVKALGIDTAQLAADAVETAKILNSNVTGAKIEDNVALPGNEAVGIPAGTTAQRNVSPTNGDLRYNSTTNEFEGYQGGAWDSIGGGDSGGGGKNYILNPSAAADTSDVTGDSGFTVARTTTASELPEESVGTAFKISGTGLTAGTSKVAWDILTTNIDDADGGIFGRAKVAVQDISGTIDGEYTIQVYNVTQSAYVGDSDTITGTGTYYLDVPLVAAEDYAFHLIAVGPTGSNIGLSSVTIEPVSQTNGALIGKSTAYTPTVNGLSSVTSRLEYRINGTRIEVQGDITATGTAAEMQIGLPSGYTVSFASATSTVIVGDGKRGNSSDRINVSVLATDGDTFLNFGYHADGTNATELTAQNGDDMIATGERFSFWASVPVAELAQAHTPMASDVQYENNRFKTTSLNETVTSGSVVLFATSEYNTGDITFASGVATINTAGFYDISASTRVTSAGVTILEIEKDGTTRLAESGDGSANNTYAKVSTTVELAVGDTIQINNSSGRSITTFNAASINFFAITRIPDFSARKAGLPFSTLADTTERYLLMRYQKETVAADNDFSTGNFICSRIGDMVTINTDSVLSHSSASQPATSSGRLPAEYRPSNTIDNTYYHDSGVVGKISVASDGTITLRYTTWTGSASARTNNIQGLSISYNIS